MVEVHDTDDEAGTAVIEMNRGETFDIRNALFSADYDRPDSDDGEAYRNLRDAIPSPTDVTHSIHVRLTAEQIADVSNGLFAAAEVDEAAGRGATARSRLRTNLELIDALREAGYPDSAEARATTARDEIGNSRAAAGKSA